MGNSPAINDAGHEFHKFRLREPLSDSFLGTRYRAVSSTSSSARAASNAFGSDASGVRSTAFALRLLRAPSAGLIERVARGAKAVRFLEHPNVLAPIQLIRSQTRLGVITQDVDGCTLSDVLRKASSRGEALPQAMALRIALDILEGVGALHACEPDAGRYQYACGGLNPDSIHVGKDGRTRLLDPGVAGAAASLPFWGHDPVALAYTAPEHSGAEPHFNPTSDVFSVGVMLWEMLAGRALFGATTAAETLEHLHKTIIPRVQRHHFVRGEPIAAAVAQVVAHALQRDPQLRYKRARDLVTSLTDADDVSTHAEVAEHCHRLAGNSAGVFDGAVRVRPVVSAAEFELPTGSIPPALMSKSGPPPSIDSLRPDRSTEEVASDAFEPATAKLEAPILSQLFPVRPPLDRAAVDRAAFDRAALERQALERAALERPERAEPHRPITAFPISDLVRTSPVVRQVYAPLAAAAALVLGLGYLAIQELGSHAVSPPTAATSQPPAAAQPEVRAPELAPPSPRVATPPVEPMPPSFGGPEPTAAPAVPAAPVPAPTDDRPTVTVENTAAGAPVAQPEVAPRSASHAASPTKKWEPKGRRGSKSGSAIDPKSEETDSVTNNAPRGPFIPDDL